MTVLGKSLTGFRLMSGVEIYTDPKTLRDGPEGLVRDFLRESSTRLTKVERRVLRVVSFVLSLRPTMSSILSSEAPDDLDPSSGSKW